MDKVKVRKRADLDEELPWMILCGDDCYSPSEGINAHVGWPDQEIALRVANRHSLYHERLRQELEIAELRREAEDRSEEDVLSAFQRWWAGWRT